MSTRRKLISLAAAILTAAAVAFGLAGSALAVPPVQFCTFQNPDHCVNRAGGGTGNGTHLITYHQDDGNNDFKTLQLFNFCGGTGIVRNGEGGQVCPFRNGSGLNARYDGKPIFEIVRDNDLTRCAAIPAFSNGPGVALEDCGFQGYAWVDSSNFYVSVGQSNWRYDNFHISNDPWWLYDLGLGSQLSVLPQATFTWGCVTPTGGGGC